MSLGLGVGTLTDVLETDEPTLVDEIDTGPGAVPVAIPERKVVVEIVKQRYSVIRHPEFW